MALTTNGALLASKAAKFKAASLGRVRVSLDSLDEATFLRKAGAVSSDRIEMSRIGG